jgi:hypothetical protein
MRLLSRSSSLGALVCRVGNRLSGRKLSREVRLAQEAMQMPMLTGCRRGALGWTVGLCITLLAIALLGAGQAGSALPSRQAAEIVVLGSKDYLAPFGKGWGKARPRKISNGGAASGVVRKIHWRNWGGSTARGQGRGFQYRPNGGYFRRTVSVRLRAKRIGHCRGGSGPAYTGLRAQYQKKPGGPYGKWFDWAGDRNICRYG